MKIEMAEIEPLKYELSVEIPQEVVDSTFAEIYQRITKEARIPGFRKGKAPLSIIKARFGEYVKIEAIETIFKDFYPRILEETKIKPVGEPSISELDFDEGKPLKFKLILESHPEFELADYSQIEIEKKKFVMTEEFIDNFIERLRENYAEYKDKETEEIKDGDLIVIDYETFEGEEPLENSKIEGATYIFGSSKKYKDNPSYCIFEGLDKNLENKKVGDSFSFEVNFPEDYFDKKVAGKTIRFKCTLKAVKEKVLPELNEEFFKKFNVTSLEALREKVKTELEVEYERLSKSNAMEQIISKLIELHDFPVPPSIVEKELEARIKNYELDMRVRGINPTEEELKEAREKLKEEVIKEIKANYILSKIAEKEGIEVTRDEIERNVEVMAKSVNTTVEKMASFLRSTGRIGKIIENIAFSKTLEFLLEKVQIKEVVEEIQTEKESE